MVCSCSKLLLIAANFVLALAGFFLLLLGLLTKSDSENGTYVLIGCGSIMFVVSLIGLSGAALNFSFLLVVYSLLVLLSMLVPVAGTILVWQVEFTQPINQYLQNATQEIINNYQHHFDKEEVMIENNVLNFALGHMIEILEKIEEGWLIDNKYLTTGVAGGVLLIQLLLIILTICTNKKQPTNTISTTSTVTTISTISSTNPSLAPSAPQAQPSSHTPSRPLPPPPPRQPPQPPKPSAPKLVALNDSKFADNHHTELVLHPFAIDPPVEPPVYYTNPNSLDFDCKVCMEPMAPPKKIYQCKDGHSLCESCSDNPAVTSCPFCRRPLTGGRNLALEDLAQQYFKKLT